MQPKKNIHISQAVEMRKNLCLPETGFVAIVFRKFHIRKIILGLHKTKKRSNLKQELLRKFRPQPKLLSAKGQSSDESLSSQTHRRPIDKGYLIILMHCNLLT